MSQENSRRDFFRHTLAYVGGAAVAVQALRHDLAHAQSKAGAESAKAAKAGADGKTAKSGADAKSAKTKSGNSGTELKKVDMSSDTMAQTIGYVEDSPKEDQNCLNCALYAPKGKIDGEDYGKCALIQSGLVAAAGWCKSWAPKPS